jgi:hypothetical protein
VEKEVSEQAAGSGKYYSSGMSHSVSWGILPGYVQMVRNKEERSINTQNPTTINKIEAQYLSFSLSLLLDQ